mmetsp:Transcript_34940/g.87480  ORF Transcript_34940/g.87480 Transcript_34940/m.87480 type:complete len:236 (+) Transcript_34940:517-1224(+)
MRCRGSGPRQRYAEGVGRSVHHLAIHAQDGERHGTDREDQAEHLRNHAGARRAGGGDSAIAADDVPRPKPCPVTFASTFLHVCLLRPGLPVLYTHQRQSHIALDGRPRGDVPVFGGRFRRGTSSAPPGYPRELCLAARAPGCRRRRRDGGRGGQHRLGVHLFSSHIGDGSRQRCDGLDRRGWRGRACGVLQTHVEQRCARHTRQPELAAAQRVGGAKWRRHQRRQHRHSLRRRRC